MAATPRPPSLPLRESRRKILGIFVYEASRCEEKVCAEAEIVSRFVFSRVPVVVRKTWRYDIHYANNLCLLSGRSVFRVLSLVHRLSFGESLVDYSFTERRDLL